MSVDVELDVWREQWRAETAVPAVLRRKVTRQSLWMRLALIGDTLVTIVMGGGVTAWAVLSRESDVMLLAAATWLFIAAAWIFALKIHRGKWSPSGQSTAAFLDLSIDRCRSRLATTLFAGALFLVEIVFCLAWVYLHGHRDRPLLLWLFLGSMPIDLVWGMTLAFFGFLIWYRRRKSAELAWLLDVRAQLSTEPGER